MKNRFYTAMWKLLRPLVLLLHPLDIQGKENMPDEPVMICANHSSGWDPILLVCALACDFPLRIMAKQQLFKIPVVGGFIRRMGAFSRGPGQQRYRCGQDFYQESERGLQPVDLSGRNPGGKWRKCNS